MLSFIQGLVQEIASIGATPAGGASRLSFSAEDQQVRALFARKMQASGLAVRQDAFGNLFGRLAGADPLAPVVATGSHLDTVPDGGNYDGVLGCVTGLAVLRELAARQAKGEAKLRHPLECIAFQSEESTRFASSTLGSKVMCGHESAELLRLTDAEGWTLAKHLQAVGLDSTKLAEACLPAGYFKAFIELHMDQGPSLEDANLALGIITHIVGVRRAKIYFTGFASHAGGTPMLGRKDALLAAAETVLAMNELACSYAGQYSLVGTVGQLQVSPGAINVVPGLTELYCELRATDSTILEAVWAEFQAKVQQIAEHRQTPVQIKLTETSEPVPMAEVVQTALQSACACKQIPYLSMASGAGHDCMNMPAITQAGMLFVRSQAGLSHHPGEFVRPADIAAAYQVLLDTLSALGA